MVVSLGFGLVAAIGISKVMEAPVETGHPQYPKALSW